jgi:hypothetical protein
MQMAAAPGAEGQRPGLLRTLVLSSFALAAVLLAGVSYLAPYPARRVLVPAAWVGFCVAVGNTLCCLVWLFLVRYRVVMLVAFVICLLASVVVLLLIPFPP